MVSKDIDKISMTILPLHLLSTCSLEQMVE